MKAIGQMIRGFMSLTVTLASLEIHAAEANALAMLRLSSPVDYQVVQRATRVGGRIEIAGSLPNGSETSGALEARLVGAGGATNWQKLAMINPGTTKFRVELNAPAGGWYRLET